MKIKSVKQTDVALGRQTSKLLLSEISEYPFGNLFSKLLKIQSVSKFTVVLRPTLFLYLL